MVLLIGGCVCLIGGLCLLIGGLCLLIGGLCFVFFLSFAEIVTFFISFHLSSKQPIFLSLLSCETILSVFFMSKQDCDSQEG